LPMNLISKEFRSLLKAYRKIILISLASSFSPSCNHSKLLETLSLSTNKKFINVKALIIVDFVERNVKNFHFLINNQQIENRILKLAKTSLEDYQLDWKDIWERILAR